MGDKHKIHPLIWLAAVAGCFGIGNLAAPFLSGFTLCIAAVSPLVALTSLRLYRGQERAQECSRLAREYEDWQQLAANYMQAQAKPQPV